MTGSNMAAKKRYAPFLLWILLWSYKNFLDDIVIHWYCSVNENGNNKFYYQM